MTGGHDATLVTGTFDIASPDDQARVLRLADSLIAGGRTPEELEEDARSGDVSIDLALAHKLARSRQEVLDLDWSGRLAIVFAMWGEQRRLRPRDAHNPTGEDALNTKLDQLDWLFADTDVDWSVLPVDDGDPDDSATVAAERAALHPSGGRVTVLRLGDAIPADAGPLATLDHVDDSRKGGAIVLGAANALDGGADAIVMTDADNSVHLGQVGLLLRPFVGGDAGAVIGDRKHPDSVLVKAEARWGPGIVVLRHMQRMVGRALFDRGLRDTQAAFKLYGRPALESIIAAPSTFGFAFDSDWLYAAVNTGAPIERVPFAFIDSFEESASLAQGPMTTWESLLRGLVAAARARGADHDEEMAHVVDEFGDAATLERVVTQVPAELEGVADVALGQRSTMTPAALRDWLVPLTAT
ncbi:MAG: glycosyltransferase [Actinomycetota bacterium]